MENISNIGHSRMYDELQERIEVRTFYRRSLMFATFAVAFIVTTLIIS